MLALGAGASDNWPRFRGPNGDGIAPEGFFNAITEKDFAWKIALPGASHSSPVVWGDHVYVTTAADKDSRRSLLCVSAADGKTVWKYEENFTSYHKHRENSYASATPTADDLGVYIAWTTPQEYSLIALSHSGTLRWRKSLGGFRSQHGSGTSPIVVHDLVILNDDQEGQTSTLFALDHASGEIRWKHEYAGGGKAAMSTPCVWRPSGGTEQLIITTWQAGIEGFDLVSGKQLWQAKDVFFSRPIGSPITSPDLVLGVNGEGIARRELVALHPGAAGEAPKLVYKLSLIGPHVPTPLVKGDLLLMLNDLGQLTCAKLATGEVIWTQKFSEGFYGSPICAGDVLWAISRKGDLIGANIADGGKPICTFNLGEPSSATPAIAGGRMYLRTTSHLICVKGKG